MWIRMILVVTLAAMWGIPRMARADIVHTIKFSSAPVVHVWADGIAAGAGQSVNLGVDAVPQELPFYTGTLEPIPASASFGMDPLHLSVASNAGFVIEAELVGSGLPSGVITVSLVDIGENASADGAPVMQVQTTASDLMTSSAIFAISKRTAVKPGSVETQTITLRIESPAPLALTVRAQERESH